MSQLIPDRNKKKLPVSRTLLIAVWILGIMGILTWLYLIYYLIFGFKMGTGPNVVPAYAWSINIIKRITGLLLSGSAVYIAYRVQTKAALFYALLIAFFSHWDSVQWLITSDTISAGWYYVYAFEGTVFFALGVKVFQEFPVRLNNADIARAYYGHWAYFIVRPLCWLLIGWRPLFVFIGIQLICLYVFRDDRFTIGSIVPILISFLYMYVQFRKRNVHHRNSFYWTIWFFVCLAFILSCYSYFTIFKIEIRPLLGYILYLMLYLPLVISVIMTVYFSTLVDAQLILRRTVLFASVFFIAMFLFGTIEHLIIHNLSHLFHFDETYITAAFAALIGMLVHPIKERISHWLKRIEKK
ncbi:MAG: hypothetical protein QM768_20255 [Agriterribacter sp.]